MVQCLCVEQSITIVAERENPMKCILMNKNVAVVSLEIDSDTAAIIKIIESMNLEYLPVGIDIRTGIPDKKGLNEWWFGRAIPASRSGLRTALDRMEIHHSEQLLLKCYGLSLSDQYWIKPENSELTWSMVNFFENNFSDDVGNILFEQPVNSRVIDMLSPCNTSDGWLKKKWKIIDGKRCLIKAGSNPFMQEPLNELIGTKLHKRLQNKNYVEYSLLWENGIPYSVCEDFINAETELVSAVSINKSLKRRSQNSSYQHFITACKYLGIPGMQEYIDYMLVFDYLIANTDRHFGNFGAIRDVNTLEWIGPAPVFDSGTSLWHDKLAKSINDYDAIESKPFYADWDKQMNLVSDFRWIPFEQLEMIEEDIRSVFAMSEYMDEQRIDAIVKAVRGRIKKLKEMASEHEFKRT